jgi:hypothetical protein
MCWRLFRDRRQGRGANPCLVSIPPPRPYACLEHCRTSPARTELSWAVACGRGRTFCASRNERPYGHGAVPKTARQPLIPKAMLLRIVDPAENIFPRRLRILDVCTSVFVPFMKWHSHVLKWRRRRQPSGPLVPWLCGGCQSFGLRQSFCVQLIWFMLPAERSQRRRGDASSEKRH